MPIYKVTAPDGRTFKLTGDSPPSSEELEQVFSSMGALEPSDTFEEDPDQTQADIENANVVTPEPDIKIETELTEPLDVPFRPETTGLSTEAIQQLEPQELGQTPQEVESIKTDISGRIEKRRIESEERKARRLSGNQPLGERLEDIALTTGATESPTFDDSGKIFGLLSLPARALGAAIGQGDISEEATKLFKGSIQEVKDWADSRRAQDQTADEMIANLRSAMEGSTAGPEADEAMIAQIDAIEDSKNSGVLTTAIEVINNFTLETASDPLAIVSVVKNAIVGGVKVAASRAAAKEGVKKTGKEVATDIVEGASEVALKRAEDIGRKKLGASDITIEQDLGKLGGPKKLIKKLEDAGIKINSRGEFTKTRQALRKAVLKLDTKGVKKFDKTDALENQIKPVSKSEIVRSALEGNILAKDFRPIVDDILASKNNSNQIRKILKDQGFDDEVGNKTASELASQIAKLSDNVSGTEVRKLITNINAKVGAKRLGSGASTDALIKFRGALNQNLQKGIKDKFGADGLTKYKSLREGGIAEFSDIQEKLGNIIKRNADDKIQAQKSVDAMEQQFNRAMNEIKQGDPAEAVEVLKDFDRVAGTNISELAKMRAIAEELGIDLKGEIGKLPRVAPDPTIGIGPGAISIGAGPGVAKAAVATQVIGKGVGRLGKRSKRKAIELIGRTTAKNESQRTLLREALTSGNIDEYITSLTENDILKALGVLTSNGMITTKQIVELVGREKADQLAEQANKSNDAKVKNFGRVLKR